VAELGRKVTRGPADAAADVKNARARREIEGARQVLGRLAAADMELVDRREVVRPEACRILSHCGEGTADRRLEAAMGVVVRHLCFGRGLGQAFRSASYAPPRQSRVGEIMQYGRGHEHRASSTVA